MDSCMLMWDSSQRLELLLRTKHSLSAHKFGKRQMCLSYWFALISQNQKSGDYKLFTHPTKDLHCMHWVVLEKLLRAYIYSVDSLTAKELLGSSYCHAHLHDNGMVDPHAYRIQRNAIFTARITTSPLSSRKHGTLKFESRSPSP